MTTDKGPGFFPSHLIVRVGWNDNSQLSDIDSLTLHLVTVAFADDEIAILSKSVSNRNLLHRDPSKDTTGDSVVMLVE